MLLFGLLLNFVATIGVAIYLRRLCRILQIKPSTLKALSAQLGKSTDELESAVQRQTSK